MGARSFGSGNAQLSAVIAALRATNEVTMNRELRRELSAAARPFAPQVRAAILNIPTKGPKHTGLRVRIAACVQTWATITGPDVQIGIEIDSSRMPNGQKSLPLMMEGAKIWRHPVYGDRANWVGQDSHPYFYQAVVALGPASRTAIDRATQKMAARINAA